jgi:hypothetical protein
LLESVLVFTQAPEHTVCGCGHTQLPPSQDSPIPHVMPQAPQLFGSTLVFTHVPAHGISGATQPPPAPPLPLAVPLELHVPAPPPPLAVPLELLVAVPPPPLAVPLELLVAVPPPPLAVPLELLLVPAPPLVVEPLPLVPGLPPEPPLPEVSPTDTAPLPPDPVLLALPVVLNWWPPQPTCIKSPKTTTPSHDVPKYRSSNHIISILILLYAASSAAFNPF